ncbi:serine/threonine-protein kinase [Streptomyces sp. YS415]|uniref:serine/threonine-protein kinase n=1 Tax=Streptomyces sp. YS415 TaxID=2944806 RepID=UPI00202245A9|nr:serine/threonine-protein kinase [Streptomyces sp. YS415]MCL7425883.1 protein kinase [Streptomyces sp. YS415]
MKVRSWPIRPDHRLTAHVVAGRYRLDDLLGRGGAADVYEGMDLRLRRPVAVKVFRPDGAADTEERFDSEGRLLAQLQHPGLITVYDCGRDEATPFLVMELVRGTTLRRRITAAPLAPAEACRIGAALASALAHVHRAGVVHRDVKPANILLDEAGVPRLTDFGISRLLGTTAHTVTGALVGTAAYMAPEQVLGRGAGPAADIYSLGLVLIECIKGELEYDGAPLEAAIARLHRPPVMPTDIPAPLVELLEAMTDADENRRPEARACERALAALASEGSAETATASSASAAPPVNGEGEPGERNPDTLRSHGAGAAPRIAAAGAAAPASDGRSPSGRPAPRRAGRMLLTAGAALTVLGVGLAGSVGGPAAEAENAGSAPPRPATTEPAAPGGDRSGASATPSPSAGAADVSGAAARSAARTGSSRGTGAEAAAIDDGTASAPGGREPQRDRASGPGAAAPAAEKAEAGQGKSKQAKAKGKHAR